MRKFCGNLEILDLIPNGREIEVTDSNKYDYIKAICYKFMKVDIQSQTEAFLLGFQELIPQKLITFFNYQELELMLTGLSEINIEDLQKNTEFQDYSPNSQVIHWFWELLESFNKTEKTTFLQFVTGKFY